MTSFKRVEVPQSRNDGDDHSSGDDMEWFGDQTLQALHEAITGEAQTTSIHANTGPEAHM